MQPGVDPALKRQALRTLVRDPRFNVMDGLDIYIRRLFDTGSHATRMAGTAQAAGTPGALHRARGKAG
jgi:hypothetical protein